MADDIVIRLNGVPNDTAKEAREEILKLRKKTTQRGARMQHMLARLETIRRTTAIDIPKEIYDFFDTEGIPL